MKFELWKHEDDGVSYTLIAVDENYGKHREFMQKYESGSELLLTIDAESSDEACSQRNKFLGWEPYVPMKDD